MFKGKLRAVVPIFAYPSLPRSGPHSAYPKNAHSEPPSRSNIYVGDAHGWARP